MLTGTEIRNVQQNLTGTESTFSIVFRALGDKMRFQVFTLLLERDELCVTDVAGIFSISVPAASYQLKILENAGLVHRERMGQMICYRAKKEKPVVALVVGLLSL